MWETWVWSLGWEDPLGEDMETHSSIHAWRIPMERGAWLATGGHKKSDRTDQLSTQHWEIGIISTYLFDALRAIMGGSVEGKPLELFFTTKIVNYKQYCIPGVTAEIGDAIKDLKNVGVWYISHLHLAHLAGLCKSWVDLGGLNQILNPIVTTISDILFLLEKIDMAFGILYADIELGWASPDYTP